MKAPAVYSALKSFVKMFKYIFFIINNYIYNVIYLHKQIS